MHKVAPESALSPLQRAMQHIPKRPRRRALDPAELSLAIAWAEDRVTTSQAQVGFKLKSAGQLHWRLAAVFRWGIREGYLKATEPQG